MDLIELIKELAADGKFSVNEVAKLISSAPRVGDLIKAFATEVDPLLEALKSAKDEIARNDLISKIKSRMSDLESDILIRLGKGNGAEAKTIQEG